MDNKYYELHVTVQPERVLDFAKFCEAIKAKPLYIQLNRGEHRDQLMLAQTHMLPGDGEALAWASDFADVVIKPHFSITRVKLESRLVEGANCYYEAHWKLDTSPDPRYWAEEIEKYVDEQRELLYSRNLFDTRIHYLSQRIYNSVDHLAASTKFNGTGIAINFAGLPLAKVHYERALFDSNPDIDAGWEL